jgi:predicted metallopeptidase
MSFFTRVITCELDSNPIQNYEIIVEGFDPFNSIGRVKVNLYSLIHLSRRDPNLSLEHELLPLIQK